MWCTGQNVVIGNARNRPGTPHRIGPARNTFCTPHPLSPMAPQASLRLLASLELVAMEGDAPPTPPPPRLWFVVLLSCGLLVLS